MARFKIVPLFYSDDEGLAKEVLEVCRDSGFKEVEFLNRGEKSREVFSRIVNVGGVSLGAGTVKNGEDAEFFIDKGARFIVSPFFEEAVFSVCESKKISYIPGALTIAEINHCFKKTSSFVKVFPIDSLGGVKYIKSILSVLPDVPLLPSGGVGAVFEEIRSYKEVGCAGLGLGGSLISKELLSTKDMNLLKLRLDLLRGLLE